MPKQETKLHPYEADPKVALKAIKARLNGVWDEPALMILGPLLSDAKADIAEIIELANV